MKLFLEVADNVLIIWACLMQTTPDERANLFQTCDLIQSVEDHHCPEENHSKKVTPDIHGLIVELEERLQDTLDRLVVADTITSMNEFVVNEMIWGLWHNSDEGLNLIYDFADRGLLSIPISFAPASLFPPSCLLYFLVILMQETLSKVMNRVLMLLWGPHVYFKYNI